MLNIHSEFTVLRKYVRDLENHNQTLEHLQDDVNNNVILMEVYVKY